MMTKQVFFCDEYEARENHTLDTLRKEMRSKGLKGTWVAFATRMECMYALYLRETEEDSDNIQYILQHSNEEKIKVILGQSYQDKNKWIEENPQEAIKEVVTPKEEEKMATTETSTLAEKIAELIEGSTPKAPVIDNEAVRQMVIEEINKVSPRKLVIETPSFTSNPIDAQHQNFEELIKILASGGNAFLVGEAGSGKTTAGFNVAEALGLGYGLVACNEMTDKLDFVGYQDANGSYIPGPAYKLYKDGGILIIDEMEKGGANAMTALNAMLANDRYQFPNGELVKKHDDFKAIACGNTYGKGASRQYVGANELDASTLDRFDALEWDIDEKLEMEIATDKEWCSLVQAIREAVASFEGTIQLVVSMRATLRGEKLRAMGFAEKKIFEMLVYKGLDANTKQKVADKAAEIMESRI